MKICIIQNKPGRLTKIFDESNFVNIDKIKENEILPSCTEIVKLQLVMIP